MYATVTIIICSPSPPLCPLLYIIATSKHCLQTHTALLWFKSYLEAAGVSTTGQRKESTAWLLPCSTVLRQGLRQKIYPVSHVLTQEFV